MIDIFVEGRLDGQIVACLAGRLGINQNKYRIHIAEGPLHPEFSKGRVFKLVSSNPGASIVIYDLESGSMADRPRDDDIRNGSQRITWCPAIPTIEAWLFADEEALRDATTSDKIEGVIARLPSPELIPYPKALRNYVAKGVEIADIVQRMDISRAADRSPSLRHFFREFEIKIKGESKFDDRDSQLRQLDLDVIRQLISEVYPSDSVIFRAANGNTLNAAQMMQEVSSGTGMGLEYTSEILRVARDLLARQATRAAKIPKRY